jgi:hypothetical protein
VSKWDLTGPNVRFVCLGSISEGGSTKEVLGADYLGSMLKMETDDYVDTQPMSNAQQPDLLKMCRSRYEIKKNFYALSNFIFIENQVYRIVLVLLNGVVH